MRSWKQWGSVVVVALVVIGLLEGGSKKKDSTAQTSAVTTTTSSTAETSASQTASATVAAPAPTTRSAKAEAPSLESAAATAIRADGDATPMRGVPAVRCEHMGKHDSLTGHKGLLCVVRYTVKEGLGLSAALELIDPTRGIYKYAFDNPHMQSVSVIVRGPATTIGGKSVTTDFFTLVCDRPAARQIDWDNVGVAGLKALCSFLPSIKGLNN